MSFEGFIEKYYDIKTTSNPEQIRICCPFCGEEDFKGYIHTEKQLFKCWKCKVSNRPDGEALTGYQFIRKQFPKLSHPEIIDIIRGGTEILFEQSGEDVDFVQKIIEICAGWDEQLEAKEEDAYSSIEMPKEFKRFGEGGNNTLSMTESMAFQYLMKRFGEGTVDKIIDYDLRLCLCGRYTNRIIVPVTYRSELIWYQGRAFFNAAPKYLQEDSLPKPLFGLDKLSGGRAILVEGSFDAMALGSGAIAIFGSSLTKLQLKTLVKYVPEVVLALDPDDAGKKGMDVISKQLKGAGIDVFYVCLDEDPADSGLTSEEVFDMAKPFDEVAQLELYL